MEHDNTPAVGDQALHKTMNLDSRPVAEVSDDGKMIKLRIGHVVTPWIPARNYTYTKRGRNA